MQKGVVLLVGTRKGAFILTSSDGRRTWKISGPHFKGNEVYHMSYDRRNKLVFAGMNHAQWGPSIERSSDLGVTWKHSRTPPKFPKSSGESVSQIWHIEPGLEDEPDVVYAGVAPACLFKSQDKGDTWQANKGLMKHKTRKKWSPGAGGLCLHSIVLDKRYPDRMHIGISAVGTLYTDDGGETWSFQNKNVLADFFPDSVKYPLFGQCVHKLVSNPRRPDVLFQQNHCGIYRSDDYGKHWVDIRSNVPSRFGFPFAIDWNDPKRGYVAPLEGDFSRIAIDGKFAVWATDNDGKEWSPLRSGFPEMSYFTVLREGMVTDQEDPCGVYVGTTTGQLFASRDQGESWNRVSDGFPPILSVSASAL